MDCIQIRTLCDTNHWNIATIPKWGSACQYNAFIFVPSLLRKMEFSFWLLQEPFHTFICTLSAIYMNFVHQCSYLHLFLQYPMIPNGQGITSETLKKSSQGTFYLFLLFSSNAVLSSDSDTFMSENNFMDFVIHWKLHQIWNELLDLNPDSIYIVTINLIFLLSTQQTHISASYIPLLLSYLPLSHV